MERISSVSWYESVWRFSIRCATVSLSIWYVRLWDWKDGNTFSFYFLYPIPSCLGFFHKKIRNNTPNNFQVSKTKTNNSYHDNKKRTTAANNESASFGRLLLPQQMQPLHNIMAACQIKMPPNEPIPKYEDMTDV